MTGKGGRRPGAGRPRGTIKRVRSEMPVQAAESKIRDKLPWLVDKLFELAEGVEVQKRDRQGQTRVYSEIPDREAIKYLMDRVMGKPVQPIDLRDKIRELALAEGLTDEEATEAVAEAERMLKADRGTRR